jgi:hypothetical protein
MRIKSTGRGRKWEYFIATEKLPKKFARCVPASTYGGACTVSIERGRIEVLLRRRIVRDDS